MKAGPLKPIDLEAIEKRAAKATPGPWVRYWKTCVAHLIDKMEPGCITFQHGGHTLLEIDPYDYELATDAQSEKQAKRDAEFIAHARTDIPDLISVIRQQDAYIEELMGVALKVKEAKFKPEDGMKLALEPNVVIALLISSLHKMLGDEAEAPNYRTVGVTMSLKAGGPSGEYIVTIQRPNGKSPAQMHTELLTAVKEFINAEWLHAATSDPIDKTVTTLLENLAKATGVSIEQCLTPTE